jgi:hypothetical protein
VSGKTMNVILCYVFEGQNTQGELHSPTLEDECSTVSQDLCIRLSSDAVSYSIRTGHAAKSPTKLQHLQKSGCIQKYTMLQLWHKYVKTIKKKFGLRLHYRLFLSNRFDDDDDDNKNKTTTTKPATTEGTHHPKVDINSLYIK